jgi:hypothetical protein
LWAIRPFNSNGRFVQALIGTKMRWPCDAGNQIAENM